MGETSEKELKKNICTGILAHVDAGKTTLSESLLYYGGSIRKPGRVDKGDAFLDTDAQERERGITIFSKQAVFMLGDRQVTLLDTPGHVDFSAEMERTLQVLDYAILVISGADGVQGHTRTLWKLLERYDIPVFIFVNKMDQPGTKRDMLMLNLKKVLSDSCIDFNETDREIRDDEAAMCDEAAMEEFLSYSQVTDDTLCRLIEERKIFPCYFGSALKMTGVEEFIQGMARFMCSCIYPTEFGARVFKIARDNQGTRLTYMKVTGGCLKVKASVGDNEKVNQIRIYSGAKYETVAEAAAGRICAVTGPINTRPGQGLGIETETVLPVLEPVLTYRIILPSGCNPWTALQKLRLLEEEEPELHIVWKEELQEIQAQIMGEVQIEILQTIIRERFDLEVSFGQGHIVYKETITDRVEGIGHFEPLRHYAEVHLLLEPGEPGSGLHFLSVCDESILDKNWQRLILTHLEERQHKGVLTGGAITDMRVVLVSGKAHLKHTEGGDFREATYRAVRHGLMSASSILLEPYYDFRLEIPEQMTGRAMADVEKMYGRFESPEVADGNAVLTGYAPVACMQGYSREVAAYSRGNGQLFCTLRGYGPCHNEAEVIAEAAYDAEADIENQAGSVFCSHGAGFYVGWQQVREYMHLPGILSQPADEIQTDEAAEAAEAAGREKQRWMGVDEIDAIMERTFNANKGKKSSQVRRRSRVEYIAPSHQYSKPAVKKQEYFLVDGYNIIFAWEELKALAAVNIDSARSKLMDILCNYQGIRRCHLILVFDAYRVAGHETEILDYHNIHVVFTKEAETADQYIEKFAHNNGSKYTVTVATSDGLEQIIIRGAGCLLLSARELKEEIERVMMEIRVQYLENQPQHKRYLFDSISEETARHVAHIRESED